MFWKKYFIFLFSASYLLLLLSDWGGRLFPHHFGYSSAHFYMAEQVGEKTRYYRQNAVYDQRIHGYLSSLLGIRHYKHYHQQRMTTNHEGLRKSHGVPEHGVWPITVTGDSSVFGSYNSDEQTLSARLHQKLKLPVRNLAFPGHPITPMTNLLQREEKISPLIIWGMTERSITKEVFDSDQQKREKSAPDTHGFERFKEWFDVHAKDSFVRYLANLIWMNFKYYVLNEIPDSLWTPLHPQMLFYREGVGRMGRVAEPEELKIIGDGAEALVREASSRGATVVILLIPDKCTIYPEYVSDPARWENLRENRFLDHLETSLRDRHLHVINLWPVFRARKSEGWLYYPDDTHWNPRGIGVATDAVMAYLRKQNLTPQSSSF